MDFHFCYIMVRLSLWSGIKYFTREKKLILFGWQTANVSCTRYAGSECSQRALLILTQVAGIRFLFWVAFFIIIWNIVACGNPIEVVTPLPLVLQTCIIRNVPRLWHFTEGVVSSVRCLQMKSLALYNLSFSSSRRSRQLGRAFHLYWSPWFSTYISGAAGQVRLAQTYQGFFTEEI